ncbi:hypothetical protein EES41_39690 (plasmid) [Streptomyces sp. ADI95-16]|nr:hypothetical protein EES41_39690 [Streptomyces sp. ADI95-16]
MPVMVSSALSQVAQAASICPCLSWAPPSAAADKAAMRWCSVEAYRLRAPA